MPEGMKGALPAYLPKGRDNSMTRDETYNGWTNWETWLFYTHITSYEETYSFWVRTAERLRNQHELAGKLKSLLESDIDTAMEHSNMIQFKSFIESMLLEAIHIIDFQRVASHILDEALGEEV